jgi:hypothetical protein
MTSPPSSAINESNATVVRERTEPGWELPIAYGGGLRYLMFCQHILKIILKYLCKTVSNSPPNASSSDVLALKNMK